MPSGRSDSAAEDGEVRRRAASRRRCRRGAGSRWLSTVGAAVARHVLHHRQDAARHQRVRHRRATAATTGPTSDP